MSRPAGPSIRDEPHDDGRRRPMHRNLHSRRGLTRHGNALTMRLRSLLTISAVLGALAVALPAHARGRAGVHPARAPKLEQHPPPAGVARARRAGQRRRSTAFVDYDELTRRAFGEPCHPSHPELRGPLGELRRRPEARGDATCSSSSFEKNYRKNLHEDARLRRQPTRARATQAATRASSPRRKSKPKPRDPPVRVDYIVKQTDRRLHRVVDIITEGSSLTKNYYEQFRKKMDNPTRATRTSSRS